MKLNVKLRGSAAIREVARRDGVSTAKVRREIQACIDEAWATQDPSARARWAQLFPSGKKPSVEEFVCRLSAELQKQTA